MSAGHYEQKQLLSRSRIVAWSHGARFGKARALVEPYAGKKLLDYGCGDGTFLRDVVDLFPDSTGAEIAELNVLRTRLPQIRFLHVDEIAEQYDVITCLEVLEHCSPETVSQLLSRFSRLVRPHGTVIISVPVEIGLTLLGKQVVRRVAGWRGVGDYKYSERYTWPELLKMVFATSQSSVEREISEGRFGHKGFNWCSLEKEIRRYFKIRERYFSPSYLLRSQVWFVCERLNTRAAS